MYLNYEILLNGYKTIYLGESLPTNSLKDIKTYFDNITYVCYMTVEPDKSEINNYVKQIANEVLDDTSNLWIIGRMAEHVVLKNHSDKVTVFHSIENLVEKL